MKITAREPAEQLAEALCKDIFHYGKAQQYVDSGAGDVPPELSNSISEARVMFRARVTPEHFVVLEDALQEAGLGAARRDPAAKTWTVMPPAEEHKGTPLPWPAIALLFLLAMTAAALLLQ